MNAKEWRHHIRALALVSRPDDMEEELLRDFEAAEGTAEREREIAGEARRLAFRERERADELSEAGNENVKTMLYWRERAEDQTQIAAEERAQRQMAEAEVERLRAENEGLREEHDAQDRVILMNVRAANRETERADKAEAYGREYISKTDPQIEHLGARIEALEGCVRELLEVADLRGDADLPHPEDDDKLWTARMQTAWDDLRALLSPAPSSEEEEKQ